MTLQYVKDFSTICKYLNKWSYYEMCVGYKNKMISKDDFELYAREYDDLIFLIESFETELFEETIKLIIDSKEILDYDDAVSKWIFAYIYVYYNENNENVYDIIELLYADLNYPDEISNLVPYMPKQNSKEISEILEDYIAVKKKEYLVL